MTWDVPTANDCPKCGQTMFKKSGRGRLTPFCINEECENFLPEDKRGYKRKPAADTTSEPTAEAAAPTEKKTAKSAKTTKSAAKKPAAKKTTKKAKEQETADA